MTDETIDDYVGTDITSIDIEFSDLSPDHNESDDKNRVDKPTHPFIKKISLSADMEHSTLRINNIHQNYSNLSSVSGQYQINPGNKILLDRSYSSTQESLCTECAYDNKLNSLFAAINYTQSSCFPSVINQNIDITERDQFGESKLLRKRSLSVTPDTRNSAIHMKQFSPSHSCMKKFKSEDRISTIKNTGRDISKTKSATITHEISIPKADRFNDFSKHTAALEKSFSKLSDHDEDLSHPSTLLQIQSQKSEQTESVKRNDLLKNIAQDIEKKVIDGSSSSDDDGSNHSSLNEIVTSQSQDLDTNYTKCSNSSFSQNTIEEIYDIHVTDVIDDSKKVESMKELQETRSSFGQRTIDWVHHTDSLHVVDELKTNLTNSKNQNAIKDERENINRPVDLTTDKQLDNIERVVETAPKEINSVNSKSNPTANNTSMKDQNISITNVQSLCEDDWSLDCLSESQLQRIEEEAYTKTSTIDLKNSNAKSIMNEKDMFYRPERLNLVTEKGDDDPILPNRATNPALESKCDKLERIVQMQRQYINKMRQELLRKSAVISRIGSMVHAELEHADSEAVLKFSSPIQDFAPIYCTENKANNRSEELRVPGNIESTTNRDKTVAADSEDIFYVPPYSYLQSSRSKSIAPSNTIASADTAMINTNGLKKEPEVDGKFYDPRLNISKYDAPQILNRPKDVEFNRGSASRSSMQNNAPNSLVRNFDSNRTRKPDDSSVWYNGRESETGIQNRKSNINEALKNTEIIENRINLKMLSNAAVTVNSKTGLYTNKIEPVTNDTVFYLPDGLSSVSSNNRILPGVKNSRSLLSLNFSKQASTQPRNFGKSLAPHSISNDSIFYKGNRENGTTFNML